MANDGFLSVFKSYFFSPFLNHHPEPTFFERLFSGIDSIVENIVSVKRSILYSGQKSESTETGGTLFKSSATLLFTMLEQIINQLMDSFQKMTIADFISISVFIFGIYIAIQFYKAEIFKYQQLQNDCLESMNTNNIFETIEPLSADCLQEYISNVSTLIEKMHESHSQITKRMWELEVPLTMVKYRTKMMNDVYADPSSGDASRTCTISPSVRTILANKSPKFTERRKNNV